MHVQTHIHTGVLHADIHTESCKHAVASHRLGEAPRDYTNTEIHRKGEQNKIRNQRKREERQGNKVCSFPLGNVPLEYVLRSESHFELPSVGAWVNYATSVSSVKES